jgi:hypothetical protein
MGQLSGPLTGAPIGLSGVAVVRLPNADGALPVNNGIAAITPSAPHTLTLPPLSGQGDGDRVTLTVLAAFVITVNGSGTDPINDVGAPGTVAVPGSSNRTFVADRTTLPNTWLTLS